MIDFLKDAVCTGPLVGSAPIETGRFNRGPVLCGRICTFGLTKFWTDLKIRDFYISFN